MSNGDVTLESVARLRDLVSPDELQVHATINALATCYFDFDRDDPLFGDAA